MQAVGGQPSEEVNHPIVPREQTEGENPQQSVSAALVHHNGLAESDAAEASQNQAVNEANTRQLEERLPPSLEMQLADALVVVAPTCPNQLRELNIRVSDHLQSGDRQPTQLACYPHNGQTSGRLWSFVKTAQLAKQMEQRRGYSIQETNLSQEQAQPVENVCTYSFFEQQTLNRQVSCLITLRAKNLYSSYDS